MSQTLDRAEALRAEAITILLAERQAIDSALASLSYDGGAQPATKKPPAKKAPAKAEAELTPSETKA